MLDESYAYAVARIRSLEARLLDKNKLERVLEASNYAEILKILQDAGYEVHDQKDDFDTILNTRIKDAYQLIESMIGNNTAIDLFLLKNDFHNIKVLLKSEFLGENHEKLLLSSGKVAKDKLTAAIFENNLSVLPKIYKEAIINAKDVYGKTLNARLFEMEIDYYYIRLLYDAAKDSDSLVQSYVSTQIDLINIQNFIRLKNTKASASLLQRSIHEGGYKKKDFYLKMYSQSIEKFIEELKGTVYEKILIEAMDYYKKNGSLLMLEKNADDFLLEILKKSKYTAFGIDPILAYLAFVETEVKNLRIILTAKINNLSKDRIRERVRRTYA